MPNLNGDKPETVIITSQSALYQPVISVSKDGEKSNKDRVSFKYSSESLLNIRNKCDFSLANNLVFSAPKNLKNFNFCKLSQNNFVFTDHKPQFPSNNTKKVENKPQLKQKRNFNSLTCSKKIPLLLSNVQQLTLSRKILTPVKMRPKPSLAQMSNVHFQSQDLMKNHMFRTVMQRTNQKLKVGGQGRKKVFCLSRVAKIQR